MLSLKSLYIRALYELNRDIRYRKGFRIWGSGVRVSGGHRVPKGLWGLGFKVWGGDMRAYGSAVRQEG